MWPSGSIVPADEEPTSSLDIDFSEVTYIGVEPEFRDVRAKPLDAGDPVRLGEYAVLASFQSSPSARVLLGYRASAHGVIRAALLKWVAEEARGYDDFRSVLIDEARAMSALSHPNLVSVLDTGEDGGGAFIALEYVAGTDLSRIVTALKLQERKFPVSMVCYVASNVLRGLHHAHTAISPLGEALDIVHRDVNPPNILVSNSGHIKLGDFGIARMHRRLQDETDPGLVKGKFSYLAPEYISDGEVTPQADVYAVGVTMFELISGRRCFVDSNYPVPLRQIVHEGVPVDDLYLLDVPGELVEIVRKATARSPLERYDSASEMAAAVELWLMRSGSYVGPALFRNFLADRPYTVDMLANELAFHE